MLLRTTVEKKKMIAMTTIAPKKAANRMAAKPLKFTLPTDKPPPRKSMTRATPKPAPLLIPKMLGPASGLRKAVCSMSPLTANAAPQSVAVIAWGNRDWRMINCHDAFELSSPKRMFITSGTGIATEPRNRLRMKSTTISPPKAIQYATPLFMGRI